MNLFIHPRAHYRSGIPALAILISLSAQAADAPSPEIWTSSQKPPSNATIEMLSPPDQEPAETTRSVSEGGRAVTISQRIAGSAFRPRDSVVDFDVSGTGGCIYAENNAFDVFNTAIWLPQGTTVGTLRMYYNDTSTSNSQAWFSVYNLYGAIVDEWSVSSIGNVGNGFNDSDPIDHVIDYNNYSYLINWRPVVAGTEMQLCGFRIFHTPPSPLVFHDRFEQ